MCVVLGVSGISVFDAVAFLACMHRVSSAGGVGALVRGLVGLMAVGGEATHLVGEGMCASMNMGTTQFFWEDSTRYASKWLT